MGYLDWEGDGTRDKEKLGQMSAGHSSNPYGGSSSSGGNSSGGDSGGNGINFETLMQRRAAAGTGSSNLPGIYNGPKSYGNGNDYSGSSSGGSDSSGYSYSGGGISTKNQEQEAQWIKEAEQKRRKAEVEAARRATEALSQEKMAEATPSPTEQTKKPTGTNTGVQTPVIYTPSTPADTTAGARGTASGTKDALTGAGTTGTNLPDWKKALDEVNAEDQRRRDAQAAAEREAKYRQDLAAANAEDIRRRQANAAATYLANNPQYWGLYTGETAAGVDSITFGSQGNAAREDTARRFADAINRGMRRPGYDYNPGAEMSGSRYPGGYTAPAPTTPTSSNPYTTPGTPVTPQGADEGLPSSQTKLSYDWQPATVDPGYVYDTNNPYFNGQNSVGNTIDALRKRADLVSQGYDEAKKQPGWTERDRRAYADYYADQKLAEQKRAQDWSNAYAAGRRAGYDYTVPRTSIAGASDFNKPGTAGYMPYGDPRGRNTSTTGGSTTGAPTSGSTTPTTTTPTTTTPTTTTPNMPGLGTPSNGGSNGVIDTSKVPGLSSGGTTGTTTTGTGNGSYTTPPGSQYYRPSYEQGGKVVKAPYKVGGYTEAELRAMGNRSRTDFVYNNGKPAFEGYYQAPDGNYYPVNQAKADYWRRNGGSYAGWNSYHNGQRRTTTRRSSGGGGGRGNSRYVTTEYQYVGGGGGGRGNGGGSSSGYSYGGGYTPNNGMYWNGNTSWSI